MTHVWLVERHIAYEGHEDIRAFSSERAARTYADALRAHATAAPLIEGDDEAWDAAFDANREHFRRTPGWPGAYPFSADEILVCAVPFGPAREEGQ